MDTHAPGYRNMAFLLSLGLLPACADNDKDPTGVTTDGTSTQGGPSTDAMTGTTADDPTTTTGTTAPDPTDGTSGPDATTGEGEETGATTGEVLPVPESCKNYGQKYAECYPRYTGIAEKYAQYCAQYFAELGRMSPDCVALYEDWIVCLSGLSCEEFMGGGQVCAEKLMALNTCIEG